MLGVVLADSDTADMVRGAVREIDTAETQRAVDRVQRGQQSRALGDQDIAFEPGLLPGADRRQASWTCSAATPRSTSTRS